MTALLLSVALSAAQPPAGTQPPADRAAPAAGARDAANFDGTWTVVCYEKNGQPMAEAKDAKVTVRNNTITFDAKDKVKAMRVEFVGPGMLKVTETDAAAGGRPGDAAGSDTKAGQTKNAVFVLTADYLAVCVHDDAAPAAGRDGGAATAKPAGAKSYCSVILKREGTGGERK